MQTTLLGLGIALIAALLAALIGPIFVDWDRYRTTFEEHASRFADQSVRIGGAIDVRLLPTPSIVLRDIEVGPRATPAFGAQSVRMELSLGALVRGEWRAAALEVAAPEISVSLGRTGQLTTRAIGSNFDLDRISVDRLTVSDGQLLLEDLASGARLALSKVSFVGELRSLAGPIKGEGAFAANTGVFKYGIATARGADSSAHVRVTLEPADQPLTIEAEGNLSLIERSPRFEGTFALVRPAGAVLSTGKTVASEPWKLSGKVKVDPSHALFEQLEAQYGPDERNIRLTGAAKIAFGAGARLETVLSARQIDIDRAFATSAAPDRLPLAVLRGLVEAAAAVGRPPIPLVLGFGIDTATLGGGTLQSVRGDISYADNSWSIDSLEFRAPGVTQVRLAGRTGGEPTSPHFNGLFELEAVDPGALMTWVEGADRPRTTLGALRLRGEMSLGRDRLAIARGQGELDRKPFQGNFDYTFSNADRRARLDASISAAEFDLDGAIGLFRAASGGSNFERPGDIVLAVDLGRTKIAGVQAASTKANLRFDATGLKIERLSIADLGGAAVNVRGTIDTSGAQPLGSISVAIDAQKVDGLAALIESFLPNVGSVLRSRAALLSPAKLNGSISVDAPGVGAAAPAIGATSAASRGAKPATGKLAIDGNLGALRIAISGQAAGDAVAIADMALRFDARISSPDATLMVLTGLDRVFAVGRRPAILKISAGGPASGDIRISAGLNGEGFEASADGTMRVSNAAPSGTFAVAVAANDMRGLSRVAAPFSVALKSNAVIKDAAIEFADIAGSIGGTPVRGNLAVAMDRPLRIDGQVAADAIDVPALIAAAVGAPASPQRGWSTQMFTPNLAGGLSGRIELAATQAALAPLVMVRNLRASVDLAPSELVFGNVTATVGGGTISAYLSVRSGASDVTARGRMTTVNADAQQFAAGNKASPINGRISSQLDFEGSGSNPAALFGSIRGNGSLTLENGQIAGLDDKAIDVAMRAVERGTPISAPRIAEIVGKVMDTGSLSVPWASVPFEISAGRVRFGKLVATQPTGDLALAAGIDLVEQTLDARVTLYGAGVRGGGSARPELVVAISGPIAAPRRSNDVSALVGWLTLQAVDRETKRLEAEEREAKRRGSLDAAIRELEQQPRDSRAIVPPAPTTAPTETVPRPFMPPPPGGATRRAPRPLIESAPLPLIPQ